MASPIYFIATDNPDPKHARALIENAPGFGPDLINSPGSMPRTCIAGPGGRAGFTLPGPGDPWQPGYYPDRQDWSKVQGLVLASDEPGAQLWIGTSVEPGKSPVPGDFARDDVIPGHLVTLADDQQWLIPVCRKFGRIDVLPTRMRFDHAARRWVEGDQLERYVSLSGHAERYYRHVFTTAGGDDELAATVILPFDEAAAIAAEALAVNYRLNATLIDHLALLTKHNISHILNAMIDMPGIIGLMQKVQADRDGRPFAGPIPSGSTSPSGAPAATPMASTAP